MTNFKWNAKNYYTTKELSRFLEPAKKSLIGRTVDKIMVMGHIYTSIGLDDRENRCVKYANEDEWFVEEDMFEKAISSIPTHNVSLSLDEPIVLCFGNIHFEISYCEFSNAQIAINTLTFEEISCIEGCLAWRDISKYYAKNIIGQKLSDIKINYTSNPNEYVSHYRKIGEDMYDEIILVFENGYQLEIASDIDYMNLRETPAWKYQQKIAKKGWDYYYDSKQFFYDDEKTFKELIAGSVPVDGNNLIIDCNDTFKLGFLDYDIVINNNGHISNIYYGFAVNEMNFLWNFLEAIIQSKEDSYLWCEEEGPETYFYVQNVKDNKIRFIHISNRKQDVKGLITEDFKIRQDFIASKYKFVEEFYKALRKPIQNFSIENENDLCLQDFEKIHKDSIIVKKFLEEVE